MLVDMKAFLNASEVARLLGVNRATVSRWAQKGIIPGVLRPERTRQWHIPLDAYNKLVRSSRQGRP